jgi:hypothetical protein
MLRQAYKIWVRFLSVSPRLLRCILLNLAGTSATIDRRASSRRVRPIWRSALKLKFWYSEGHFGEDGIYKAGRKVGRWRECDRFDRCRDQTYNLLYPQERARGVKPEIPVSYSRWKVRC